MCIRDREDGELFVVHFRQLFVPDNHGSAGGSVQPAHHVKQGGLAAAGGSHNGHKLTVIYGEVHAVKGCLLYTSSSISPYNKISKRYSV